jgi:hypothetical protein
MGACRCDAGYTGQDGIACTACEIGKYKDAVGSGIGDLVVNVLLEHVLIRELYVPNDLLQPGRLAKADVAVNHKRRGREQGTEVREGVVGIDHVLCCSMCISRRDTLDENLGLVEIKVEASVLLEYMLDVREHL